MQQKTASIQSRASGGAVSWIASHFKAAVFSGFLIPIVFFVVLSYYNILMYLSNYYTIFDLGLAYRTMYLFITTHSLVNWPVPYALVTAKPYTKLIYVPLSLTLIIYGGPTTVLVDMIAAVSAGGFAIFKIFKIRTADTSVGLFAQIMYFLYPASYGLMAHGGNFMIFFTPLILLSFMYYLEEKPFKSGIFAIFSMLTFSFATLLVPLFYLTTITLDKKFYAKSKIITGRVKDHEKQKNHGNMGLWKIYFIALAFIIGAILFFFEISMYSFGGLITAARLPVSSASNGAILPTTNFLQTMFGILPGTKFNFFLSMLYPFLFLPILTPYSLFILPFFLLLFYANYLPYYGVSQQYPSMVSAIIFVGFAHFLSRHLGKKSIKKFMVFTLVASSVSFLTLSPFSIGNFEQGYLVSNSHVTNLDIELNKGLSYIPMNSSVFIQNDIPQLMNRASIYMPGNYSGQTVNFSVIIPSDIGFPSDQYSGYNSTWALFFHDNPSYGLYIYIEGISIYKFGYHSNPIYSIT